MKIHSKNHHDYTTTNINNNDDDMFTEDEIEVSQILLDIPFMMTRLVSLFRFPYNWNTKKLRSALVSPPPPQPLKVVRQASSPTTPLSFSLSDSDLKSKKTLLPSKRKPHPLHLRKEELLAALTERMSTQEQLKDSIEKVKLYLDKLIVENSELKAKKQKLLLEKEREEKTMTTCSTLQMQQPPLQLQTTQVNDLVHASAQSTTEDLNQVPLIFNQVNDAVYAGPPTSTPLQPWVNQFVFNDIVRAGPPNATEFRYAPPLIPGVVINQDYQNNQAVRKPNFEFDLNVVPEDDHTMMINSKAMAAAEARQKRIQVNKEKRTRGRH